MVANTPGEIVCCAVLALPTALIAGRLGFAGRTWKALACESTSKPEITLTSELTVAALAATEIFACRLVRPSPHTRALVKCPLRDFAQGLSATVHPDHVSSQRLRSRFVYQQAVLARAECGVPRSRVVFHQVSQRHRFPGNCSRRIVELLRLQL